MRITLELETPDAFTERLRSLLKRSDTHLYFDTSFLMWLTTVGGAARAQFESWADTLEGRVHVPLWSMHEYHRHHVEGTLKKRITRHSETLMTAAKVFGGEMRHYSDLALLTGLPEAAYQDRVAATIADLASLTEAAKGWDYDASAAEVVRWMNGRTCGMSTVFRSMPTLASTGRARFTQDVPPGFLDRRKRDKPEKGSNRYGDLLFWQEVVEHARARRVRDVVVVTRDRKKDWFQADPAPEPDGEWQRLRTKWLPVPRPHPTLAYELEAEAGAGLVLVDELYLGALLWKHGRPTYERFAAVAIDVALDKFQTIQVPRRTIADKAARRLEEATIGLADARALLQAALQPTRPAAAALLTDLLATAPMADAFVEGFGTTTLTPLSALDAVSFCRALHDTSMTGPGPARAAVSVLLDGLDALPANLAAIAYLGLLCSAYFDGAIPRSRPGGDHLDAIFAWRRDLAFVRVLQVFGHRLKQVRSPALYRPAPGVNAPTLRFEHDASRGQDPVALAQVFFERVELLSDGHATPGTGLVELLGGGAVHPVSHILDSLCRYYGLPSDQVVLMGAAPDQLRLVPQSLGLRDFDRFAGEPDGHLESALEITGLDHLGPEEEDDADTGEDDDDMQEGDV